MKSRYRVKLLSLSIFSLISLMILYISGFSNGLDINSKFQAELEALRAQYRFPGATAAYILPDGTLNVFAVGLADVELGIPMVPESRMLAASIGKTFVGATVLALAGEDKLELDDPLSKWLGSRSWFDRLPNHDSITVRQLLNHTSGIPNHVENERFVQAFRKRWQGSGNPFSPEELIAYILDAPPLFAAGEGWAYTDTGYILLGLVIEQVTGNSWYHETNRRFLEPIGLALTSPSDGVGLPGLAAGYMAADNPFGLPPKTTDTSGHMVWNPKIEWSGGGFVSNSGDLAVWGKTLYEGRAMSSDYLGDLLASVPVAKNDSSTKYGVAVAIHTGGPFGPTYGHGGWIPGYTSSLRYYPDLGIAIAFQINTDIGIVDGSTTLTQDMEQQLIEVVAAAGM